MAKVIFLFSRAVLFRAWKRAQTLLASEGVDLWLTSQTAPMDWGRFVDEELTRADAVYLDITRHFPTFEPLIASAGKTTAVIVAGGMETTAALGSQDLGATETIGRYLKTGTPSDLANAVRFLLHLAGKVPEAPAPPTPPVLCGIHAPRHDHPFSNLAEFLAWKAPSLPGPGPWPIVAYCFQRSSWLDGETALPDAMVREAEAEGLLLLPIFCDWELAARITEPGHPLSKLLLDSGERLAAIWNGLFSHVVQGMGRESLFAPYDVPVFQVVRSYSQTREQWRAGDEGLSPLTVSFSIIQPEMLRCVGFCQCYVEPSGALTAEIVRATELLPQVEASDEVLRAIAERSLKTGVDGHRSDIIMLKAARTLAAYHGRTSVAASDIDKAAELSLAHRIRRRPFDALLGGRLDSARWSAPR